MSRRSAALVRISQPRAKYVIDESVAKLTPRHVNQLECVMSILALEDQMRDIRHRRLTSWSSLRGGGGS